MLDAANAEIEHLKQVVLKLERENKALKTGKSVESIPLGDAEEAFSSEEYNLYKEKMNTMMKELEKKLEEKDKMIEQTEEFLEELVSNMVFAKYELLHQ